MHVIKNDQGVYGTKRRGAERIFQHFVVPVNAVHFYLCG